MKGWFTAAELAGLCLPGLPLTKRHINRLAQAEGWAAKATPKGEPLARKREGRNGGGGLEYHVSLLPPAARAALSAQATVVASQQAVPVPKKIDTLGPAPDKPQRVLRRDARLVLLTMADAHLAANRSLGRTAADSDFARRYSAGTIEPASWVREQVSHVCGRSLHSWRKTRDAGNWHAVGGAGRKTTQVLAVAEDGDVERYIGALIIKQPFLSALQVRSLVEARFGATLRHGTGEVELPHERSFQRFVAEWKEQNRVALMKHTDPDKFKSAARYAGSNMYAGIARVNELWEIDASPADVLLKDGRHSIYVLVDIFSRRMRTLVSKTARAEAAQALLRRCILGRPAGQGEGHRVDLPAWGVPDTLRTDNGSDFLAHAFTGSLLALGITHDPVPPFSPEKKAVVERNIGTLQRFFTLMPGFIGHSVADRKKIEGRKAFSARLGESDDSLFSAELSRDQFQDYLDRWCENKFAHENHDGIGTTPFLKAQSSTGVLRMISNPRAADLLLSPVEGGWRVASKQGIRLDGGHYISGALLPGTRVFVRQDPEDMGRIFVFEDEHGAFLCEAICPERAGVDPRQAVAMARAEQARIIKDGSAHYRAEARKIKARDMVEDVLALAERKKAPNLLAFPKRSEDHETEALIHAADAVEEGVTAASYETFEGGFEAPAKPLSPVTTGNVVTLPETAKQRFQRAMALREAKAKGLVIGDEDARWLGGYETHSEFKSHLAMFDEWGSEWLNA